MKLSEKKLFLLDMDGTIYLSETLFAEGAEAQARQAREHTSSAAAEEVVITVEEEAKPEEEVKSSHRPFGWIRRK